MDTLTILLIVLAVIVIAIVAFALIRKKQRSGTVLAAPDRSNRKRGGS